MNYGFARILTAKRLRPSAQGWPLRLPWDHDENAAKRLRHYLAEAKGTQPLCGWEFSKLAPRVAEAANPELEGATALRFHLEVSRFFKSDDFAGETDMLFH